MASATNQNPSQDAKFNDLAWITKIGDYPNMIVDFSDEDD